MEDMSERILRELQQTIEESLDFDDPIKDFAIIVTDENIRNKSPVVLEELHLGLESWCVQYVYQYACSKLMESRKGLAEHTLQAATEKELDHLLVGAILINPDVTTFWNMRRELGELNMLDYEFELVLSRLVLTRKHKSNDAFSYRRWLVRRSFEILGELSELDKSHVLETEIRLCNEIIVDVPTNYHCWIHRQCCMLMFDDEFIQSQIIWELEFINQWMKTCVFVSSGYHYKQFLINIIRHKKMGEHLPMLTCTCHQLIANKVNELTGNKTKSPRSNEFNVSILLGGIVQNEYCNGADSWVRYIGVVWHDLSQKDYKNESYLVHENYWLHRRFVIYKLLEALHNNLGKTFDCSKPLSIDTRGLNVSLLSMITNDVHYDQKRPKLKKSDPSKIECSNLYKMLIQEEKRAIERCISNSSEHYELIKRHVFWLKHFLKFDVEQSNS